MLTFTMQVMCAFVGVYSGGASGRERIFVQSFHPGSSCLSAGENGELVRLIVCVFVYVCLGVFVCVCAYLLVFACL